MYAVMSHGTENFEYRDNYQSSLLMAIPFAVIGLLSLNAPLLLAPTRLGGTVGLLAIALALAVHGWPRRNRLEFDDDGNIRAEDGHCLIRQARSLALVTSGTSEPGGTGLGIQLVAKNAAGVSAVLAQSTDPEVVLTLAKRLGERRHLRVDLSLPFWGSPLPEPFAQTSTAQDAVQPLPEPRRGDFDAMLWIAGGGSLFIFGVVGSLLRAHLVRAGLWHIQSLLLLCFLVVIGLSFLHWGWQARRRYRRWPMRVVATTTEGRGAESADASVTAASPTQQQSAKLGTSLASPHWFLSSGSGGPCYLVTLHRDQFKAMCLPLSTLPERDKS